MSDYHLVWDRQLGNMRLKRRVDCVILETSRYEHSMSRVTDDISDIVMVLVNEINVLRERVQDLESRE